MPLCLRNCKEKKKCDAAFPGAPDLVSSCRSWLDKKGRKFNKQHFLENVIGDQQTIQLYGIDYDTTSGIGSQKLAEQQQLQQSLIAFSEWQNAAAIFQADQQAKMQTSLLAVEAIKLQQAEQEQQQELNLLLFVAIAAVVGFLIFKII